MYFGLVVSFCVFISYTFLVHCDSPFPYKIRNYITKCYNYKIKIVVRNFITEGQKYDKNMAKLHYKTICEIWRYTAQ